MTLVQTSGSRGALPGPQCLFQLRELGQSLMVYHRMSKMSLTPTLISVTVGEHVTVTYQLCWPPSPQSTNIRRATLSARLDSKSDALKSI